MTREEAIKWLKTFKGNTGMTELSQAFDVAIKALEQEPCEDAISLETVIEWLKTKDIIKLFSQEETAMEELKVLQYVKQQPKTWHWERVTDKQGYLVWECDKCGWQQRFTTNFCPSCSAKMVNS